MDSAAASALLVLCARSAAVRGAHWEARCSSFFVGTDCLPAAAVRTPKRSLTTPFIRLLKSRPSVVSSSGTSSKMLVFLSNLFGCPRRPGRDQPRLAKAQCESDSARHTGTEQDSPHLGNVIPDVRTSASTSETARCSSDADLRSDAMKSELIMDLFTEEEFLDMIALSESCLRLVIRLQRQRPLPAVTFPHLNRAIVFAIALYTIRDIDGALRQLETSDVLGRAWDLALSESSFLSVLKSAFKHGLPL